MDHISGILSQGRLEKDQPCKVFRIAESSSINYERKMEFLYLFFELSTIRGSIIMSCLQIKQLYCTSNRSALKREDCNTVWFVTLNRQKIEQLKCSWDYCGKLNICVETAVTEQSDHASNRIVYLVNQQQNQKNVFTRSRSPSAKLKKKKEDMQLMFCQKGIISFQMGLQT